MVTLMATATDSAPTSVAMARKATASNVQALSHHSHKLSAQASFLLMLLAQIQDQI
jgi:hypothetical protein